MNSADDTSNPMSIEVPNSRSKRYLKIGSWVLFGIFCLILFTLFKLPDDRIKATIDSQINAFLAEKDISYSAAESKLSFLFGISYTMKDVTLNLPPPAPKAHVDKIQVSPSLLPLLFGKLSGSLSIVNGQGSLDSSFSVKNTQVYVSFKAKKLDLGKLGILPVLANLQGSAVLDGSGSVSGDMNVPSTLEGGLTLNLKQILIDSQSIMGFSIPRIGVSEGVIDVSMEKAKMNIKSFRIGKSGANASTEDDIRGTVTGDLSLGKQWFSSNLNVKANFSLSETIMKAFILLDAILGAGKQPDGSYAFAITGPITSPMPMPIPPNGGNF